MKGVIKEKVRMNGRIITITQPKKSITDEQFIKGIIPVIDKIIRKEKKN